MITKGSPGKMTKREAVKLVLITMTAATFSLFGALFANATPVIDPVPTAITVGDSFTITGSGFTKGSVVNFFVATATGTMNFGPLIPTPPVSPTALTVPVPLVSPHGSPIVLGQGVVTLEVINTDQDFAASNLETAQLFGDTKDGFPNLTEVNEIGLSTTSTDPSFAVDNVETVVVQDHTVTLGGNGFDTVHGVAIDLFCDCAGDKITVFLNPGNPGLSATALTFTLASSVGTGPGSFVIYNAGAKGDYAIKSNAVSVPIGTLVTVSDIKQDGCTVTMTGTGFAVNGPGLPNLTVINLFNKRGSGTVNLGGLNKSGAPNIALDVSSSTQFSFTVPGSIVPGPAYLEVINPPFVPFTTSGDSPAGAFTAASCPFTTFDAPGAAPGAESGTSPSGINTGGEITGTYLDVSSVLHCFLRSSEGTFTTFDAPGAVNQISGTAINTAGTVAGLSKDASKVYQGFLRASDGTFTTFDFPTGSTVSSSILAINDAGTVTGSYQNTSSTIVSFLRSSDGTFTTFSFPGGGSTGAASINAAGTIVGSYGPGLTFHGFLRSTSGTFTTIDDPSADPANGTIADSINSAGQIAGYYFDSSHASHGFLRATDGTFTNFDAPGAGTSLDQGTLPIDINTAGTIVGYYNDASNGRHGFVRVTDGTITTFDVPGSAAGTTDPASINDAGVITGSYADASGTLHGFLRTP
jgi:hypothetical protein